MKPSEPLYTAAQFDALLRNDFGFFVRRCFLELWPNTEMKWNWHLDLIVSRLEAVRRGECRRLIINMPPRGAKSLCASIAFPAFILGHDPTAQIIAASYAQDLSDKLSRDTRTIMSAGWYKRAFGTHLNAKRPALGELLTTAGGSRLATSVGGTLTGRGGNLLIIDDPLKPADALSDVQRAGVNLWHDNTASSRLNDKNTGAVVVIMQRVHENDLVGHLLAQGEWEVLSFPAIAEVDEVHHIETFRGSYIQRRAAGEALHHERESLERLDEIERTMGSYNFAAQYQQRPAPAGGGIVRIDWFQTYDPASKPRYKRVIQSWDTASKIAHTSDFSVCMSLGVTHDDDIHLIDVFRKKLEYLELKNKVCELAALFKPQTILVEDHSSGTQLYQELRLKGLPNLIAINAKGDKKMRMWLQASIIEAGKVFLPAQAHWRAAFLHEFEMFPNGRFDDQVDSMSQALAHISGVNEPQMWNDWYKREAAKRRGEL